jgi:SAM-dependent methyltransferase
MNIVKRLFKFFLNIVNKNSYFELKIKKKFKFGKFYYNHLLFLTKKIPALKKIDLVDLKNNELNYFIYKFYLKIIPFFNKSSFNVFMRNELLLLKKNMEFYKIKNIKTYKKIDYLISKYNFLDGVIERSNILLHKNNERKKIISEKLKLEKYYESSTNIFDKNLNINFPKDICRGNILVEYFKKNLNLITGKKILHFSPEPELKKFFLKNNNKLNIKEYSTNDLFGVGDYNYDITQLGFKRRYFDLIICHRVMEHVFDDIKGFLEMKKVLSLNGIINFSIPQSVHKFRTVEFYLPDGTHNDHVRQYGMDLNIKLENIGLRIHLEKYFLKMNKNNLKKLNVYPMRIYNISRI